MRVMYDSTNAVDIPADARMVAGYVDGPYAWDDDEWDHWPESVVRVRIATQHTTNDGHVADCEQGDMTPAQAVTWVVMRRRAGADPSVYCDVTHWDAVKAAFLTAQVRAPHYWIAHWDHNTTLPAGAVAKQFNDPPASGGHYDESIVADYWPGVDPPPSGGNVTTPAENWAYENKASGDTHDMHQALDNAEHNSAAALTALQAVSGKLDTIANQLTSLPATSEQGFDQLVSLVAQLVTAVQALHQATAAQATTAAPTQVVQHA